MGEHRAPVYRIVVGGVLDEDWSDWLAGLRVRPGATPGTTMLEGEVADQAYLHGVLRRIGDLGLPLLSVTLVAGGEADADPPRPGRPGRPPTFPAPRSAGTSPAPG